MQHNLGCDFEVQGIVKPGVNTEIIVNTSPKITRKLTKKDVVVVLGGTRDVGRNETKKGLHQMKNFVSNHNQTNVIVMSVPCRYDLAPKSCVNDEVKVYNRKLQKHLKAFDNTCVQEVDTNRDLFTRHGLHMNPKGKEHMAKKIVMAIQGMLNEKKSDPIPMKNKEDLRTDNEGTEAKTIAVEMEAKLKNPKKNELSDNEPENKQTGLHHISSDRNSAERFNLDEDKSTRDNSKVIVAHEQEFVGEEEGAYKDGIVIREQAQGTEDNTQSTRDNSMVSVAHKLECVDEEDANKDGIVIWEQAQDIADNIQPRNVDKTTEAQRTSTRNKKTPSIRGNDFL